MLPDTKSAYEMQAKFMEAIKCNISLWQVTCFIEEEPSKADKAQLKLYAKRYKQIHAILAAPTNQLRKLSTNWPRIFVDMWGCEMEASIVLVALSALGEAVGPPDSSLSVNKRVKMEDKISENNMC